MTKRRWKQEEAGWFTSNAGGVCRERDGKWYFYPDGGGCIGPFRSGGSAMDAADGECVTKQEGS